MKTSKPGIDLIKYFESLHDGDLSQIGLQPKMCPAGIWTEGYGHAITDRRGRKVAGVEMRATALQLSKVKTEAEADELLADDLKTFEDIVNSKVKVKLNQNEFDALVSHTYNTGGSETLFELINQDKKSEKVKNWWTIKYTSVAGKQLKGLVLRRRVEWNFYKTGIINYDAEV